MATRKKTAPNKSTSEFRFIKLDAQSNELDPRSTEWVQVLDKQTNLIWPRSASSDRLTFNEAKPYADTLKLAGAFWRLPTITELLSLVDYERCDPAINTDFFDCLPNWHWSSTVAAASPSDYAWVVYFGYGNSFWYLQDYGAVVRPVRSAGQ